MLNITRVEKSAICKIAQLTKVVVNIKKLDINIKKV